MVGPTYPACVVLYCTANPALRVHKVAVAFVISETLNVFKRRELLRGINVLSDGTVALRDGTVALRVSVAAASVTASAAAAPRALDSDLAAARTVRATVTFNINIASS